MNEIPEILSNVSHRPYDLPVGEWKYYQEWVNALFLHWTIPFDVLKKHVPENLNIDTINGECYVSVVAFTMKKIRPKGLPSISLISDFHEINLRTYIENENKKGVYFLNIEAEKYFSALIAKSISALPYEKSKIERTNKKYTSKNLAKGFSLDVEFEIKEELNSKTALDKWLTERYCLYFEKEGETYRYDIHHDEWKINCVEIKQLNLNYKIGDINLSEKEPRLTHYSDGVKVIAWRQQRM